MPDHQLAQPAAAAKRQQLTDLPPPRLARPVKSAACAGGHGVLHAALPLRRRAVAACMTGLLLARHLAGATEQTNQTR